MKDVNDAERQGMEKGRLEGARQGLRCVLEAKFGARGRALLERLGECSDLFRLEALTRAAAVAQFVDEIHARFELPNGNVERLRALVEPHMPKLPGGGRWGENAERHISYPKQRGIDEGIEKGILVGQIRQCQLLLKLNPTAEVLLVGWSQEALAALLSGLRKQLSLKCD